MKKETPKGRHKVIPPRNKLSFDSIKVPVVERRFHPARLVALVIAVLLLATLGVLATGAGNQAQANGAVVVEPVPEVQKPVPVSTTADEVEEPSLWQKLKSKYNKYFGDEPEPAVDHEKMAREILDEMEAEAAGPIAPAPVPEPDEPVEMDIAMLTPEMVMAGVHAELNDLLNRNEKILRDRAVFDAEQMDCMARALVFETGGQPELGQRWVYHVIRNRSLFQYRGNETICDAVLDNYQISAFNEDKERRPHEKTADVLDMVRLTNELYRDKDLKDITCGATHYVRTDVISTMKNDWARDAMAGKSTEGLVLKAVIGDHSFFGKEGCSHGHRIN